MNSNAPPSSNTGVRSTIESGLVAVVDWVEVTLKSFDEKSVINDILSLSDDDFQELKHGQYGYKKGKSFGKIKVWYDGQTKVDGEVVDMGVHIVMSGQGCREYESFGKKNWSELFQEVFLDGGHFTRVDIAIDDFKGYFRVGTIENKLRREEVVSKFRRWRPHEDRSIRGGESHGKTVYIGSTKSDVQVRFYEKNLQKLNTGYIVDPEVKVWNRVEVQLRDDHATTVARVIANGEDENATVGRLVKGILQNYVRFVVKPKDGKDKNISRWKTSPFWDKFLGDVEKIRLSKQKPERTIERVMTWLNSQVTPSLAMLMRAMDGDMDVLMEMISSGEKRLNKEHERMIEEFKVRMKEAISFEHRKDKVVSLEKERDAAIRLQEQQELAEWEKQRLIRFLNNL